MTHLSSTEGYADVDEGDDNFYKLPPIPPELTVFEPPPPPDADIDVQTDPNASWNGSLMSPNTPTKRDS